jgi:hypothetical protein
MSEIRKWLESIGLAQYAEAFEANDIDMDLVGLSLTARRQLSIFQWLS